MPARGKFQQGQVEDAEFLRLSVEDQTRFVDALIDPPAPAAALKRAAKRHSTLVKPS